ncbi:MAG: signal peptidase I [Pseudomonadota bacterium]
MAFDFEILLVGLTAVSGLIWALNAVVFKSDGAMAEYGRSFFPVLLFVVLLRSFIVEPFRIPSGSMIPTLQIGDFILVNKFSYGVRLPIVHTKVIDLGSPERGDVVVFRYPDNPQIDYIKRVIGVPGDEIAYRDKQVFVNGEALPVEVVGPVNDPSGRGIQTLELKETLGEEPHRTLVQNTPFRRQIQTVVPAGQYFVMGDNRDNSADSRMWGTVPEENLAGRAFFIWMNFSKQPGMDFDVDWTRIGSRIH